MIFQKQPSLEVNMLCRNNQVFIICVFLIFLLQEEKKLYLYQFYSLCWLLNVFMKFKSFGGSMPFVYYCLFVILTLKAVCVTLILFVCVRRPVVTCAMACVWRHLWKSVPLSATWSQDSILVSGLAAVFSALSHLTSPWTSCGAGGDRVNSPLTPC